MEADFTTGVPSSKVALLASPEFKSLWPRIVRPACGPTVTGVFHRSMFSFSLIAWLSTVLFCGPGLGVRCCLRRLRTYSDSNWKSSEGGSSFKDNAEESFDNAVIAWPL
jgi:hypothetical protein